MNEVDRRERLRRVAIALRIAGIVVMLIGLMCMPGIGPNPKRDLSAFNNLADLGLFWKMGLVLLPLGAAMLVVSLVLPGGTEDE
jgi:hypothetical protein